MPISCYDKESSGKYWAVTKIQKELEDKSMEKSNKNMTKEEEQKYAAPAVRKALEILEFMAKVDKSLSLSEVVNELDITSNSAFRIFKEFEAKGYVAKDSVNSSYELTPKLYYLGNSLRNRISFVKAACPYMNNIRRYTKETVLLTILGEKNDTLVVDQIESREPIKFLSTVGVTYDSYSSAMGKAMLATFDPADIDEYISCHELVKKTETSIVNKEELIRELEKIKKTGIAYDLEENMRGLTCVACPVFSANGYLEGSIGVSGLTFRMSEATIRDYGSFIKDQAAMLSSALGYEKW